MGTSFVEAIREALERSAMAVLLLTPSYYESRFCLAEAGAVWVQQKVRVPVVVPPTDFADLDGVQLGEQALRIDRASDLDDMRDFISEVMGRGIGTAGWNAQRDRFLNEWAGTFEGRIAQPAAVPAVEHQAALAAAESSSRELGDLREEASRLRSYTRDLTTQNEQLRQLVRDAPARPQLEGDETAQYIAECEATLRVAEEALEPVPAVAREALFQRFHAGRSLTIGGDGDAYGVEEARNAVERGWLQWREDEPGQVDPRRDRPEMDAALSALNSVRETVFVGGMFESRSTADPSIRPWLREQYEITDPTFEIRDNWEKLGFL